MTSNATPNLYEMRHQQSCSEEVDVETCQRFALTHKLIFETEGTCGFGRECVGFIGRSGSYVDYNPRRMSEDYEPIAELACHLAEPPDDVAAYHKHDCMAVLGRGDEAIAGLARWVRSMESNGRVRIVEYETGATGMQALITSDVGYAVVVDPVAKGDA